MVVLLLVEEGGRAAVVVWLGWAQVPAEVSSVSLLMVGLFQVLCVLARRPLLSLHTQHAPVAGLQRGTLLIEEQAAGADMRQVPVCVEAILQERGTFPLTRA